MIPVLWSRIGVASLVSVFGAAVSACKTGVDRGSETRNLLPPDGPSPDQATSDIEFDPELGERLWPGEEAATRSISAALQGAVRARHQATGKARRDAHPKAHGCVRAEFKVDADLAPDLARGVFQPGAPYPAWIRFSNGDSDPDRADGLGDGRGMAIKLMNVTGEKLLDDETATQDFVMINHPVFFIDDPEKYLQLTTALGSSNPLVKLSAGQALGFNGTAIAVAIVAKKVGNPLKSQYWSMVPYQFGVGADKRVMKYSAKPCQSALNLPLPSQLLNRDYLRAAMKETLDAGDACFDFFVQVRDPQSVPADQLGTEASTVEWRESAVPPRHVAKITIGKQTFLSDAQQEFCENMSYTPWHAVADHRPLGGVNRVRRVVYQEISALRRSLNGALPATEPTGNERF